MKFRMLLIQLKVLLGIGWIVRAFSAVPAGIQTGQGCVGRISNPTASALADPGTHRSLAIRYWSVYLHRRFKWMYALTEYPEHNDCSRRSTFPTRLSAPMFQMAHRFQGDSVVHMHLSTIADVGERSFPRCS